MAATMTIEQRETPNGHEADLALAKTAARGDERARRELISALADPLRRVVALFANGGDDADDLLQMALIRILEGLPSYRGDCSLYYWAKRVAVRVAIKQQEKRKRRAHLKESKWSPGANSPDTGEQASFAW